MADPDVIQAILERLDRIEKQLANLASERPGIPDEQCPYCTKIALRLTERHPTEGHLIHETRVCCECGHQEERTLRA